MMTSEPVVADTPLQFDPFSDDFFKGPFDTYRRLRDEAPVYHDTKYGFYALSRFDDVAAGMKDSQTYSSARGVTMEQYLLDEVPEEISALIIAMDPPDHTRMRKLVNKVFTPRAVAELEPMIRRTVTEFADRHDPTRFDAVKEFSALFPVEIISTMLGVPPDERQDVRLRLDKALERRPGDFRTPPEGVQASIEAGMYWYELVQKRRADPTDDMISRLVEVEVEREDGGVTRLTDIEITGFLSLLGGAGAETVTKLMGSAVVLFAEHPEQWEMLRGSRDLIPAAFEEILRYEGPSQYNIRFSMRDVTLHGCTIPKHSPVMMITGSATRDERRFPDPDRFDITRANGGHNLGFGYGAHSCLGAALARMEGRIALELLADRMPTYEVDRDKIERVNMTNVMGYASVPVRVTS
ncbi:cytochrome P450 [Mycobacteroides abscessus subsp. bolletii]|nr:cytochrome P450 [Mycobacteroides abscessus subsp. bolletii]SKS88699.1 cytochrome P450 [Mycobacteroides abscessus subsp. bolletii]SKT11610.1 cytochrome P450 [Mycobacteroides abscessus subsp. bolletii]SLD07292.1 cytochrome P450 [Mycobacteroides abscessus subsp. bolletii]SLF29095.1 cytochrome P450 [Mycobacteroides abscessus subsp. bolletii]